jgi:aminoglycoside phosphotransferase family enzyme
MAAMTKPCRCSRYRFPHRYQPKCDDHIYAARELEYQGRSESDRLYWNDYHDRVRDLRRELA